jgi:hypothetical protein
MNLNNNTRFSELLTILDNQLNNSFKPHVDAIPNAQSKGIYFWFMKQSAYELFSQFVPITPIEPRYTKTLNGEKYDLVYLGTAGTGKKGNSNLKDRFEWHINQKHKESVIKQKQSALSTLRTGLSSLLSNDLILPFTERLVNDFMSSNMVLYYMEYENNHDVINKDEKILINTFKPIFNLKNNSNSHKNSISNSTKDYKIRRNLIEKNTKIRLGVIK